MIINEQNLDLVFKGFKAVYTDAFANAPVHWDQIAMTVSSSGRDETYGWLGQFPNLREWIGPRHVYNLKAHGFTIQNRTFESTVKVSRNDISDDKIGLFKPVFQEMGRLAKTHPEELVMGLLASGFDTECFDGQNFFDAEHPSTDKDGKEILVSNLQTGAEPAWYLLDTSRGIRPLIWQEREPYEFTAKDRPEDDHVFINDEFLYGVRARANAGFGLWQLGFGSKAELNSTNYAAARAAMMGYRNASGRVLGITPTVLIVPPELEESALHVLNTLTNDGGGSNPWKDTAELIVTPYIAQ